DREGRFVGPEAGGPTGDRRRTPAVDGGTAPPHPPAGRGEADPVSGAPDMPEFWTIRARRHLRRALAELLCREAEGTGAGPGRCTGVRERTMDRLNDLLAGTFPGISVVVQDQVIGYRRKDDLFVLLVEAFDAGEADRGGPFVVKIGPEG